MNNLPILGVFLVLFFTNIVNSNAQESIMDLSGVSVVSNMEEANTYFRAMGATRRRSQAHLRSYIAGYELAKYYNVSTGIAWMFFTRSFINESGFPIWFTAAPFIYVGDNSNPVVLDLWDRAILPREAREHRVASVTGPLSLEAWQQRYLGRNANCKIIDNYLEYLNNESIQASIQDCYIILSTRFYSQPDQLESYYKDGVVRTSYDNNFELRMACKDSTLRSLFDTRCWF